ncbi:hypothetical protein DFH08DRAFT_1084769 [Mycena albidolilacea]|uniref:Uncharacterized protein n=1 Tax=Mycena albidolilacea TaxID=1033008 RepID=A0AAD6ZL04_9AGAR|nr:hypothetical protein DFH08DRAFT_1084769 [Mycena albidolilacea]
MITHLCTPSLPTWIQQSHTISHVLPLHACVGLRTRDLDQIQLLDLDPKFIYLHPPKYYETDAALTSHWRSKVHKRRCKQLKEPAYTIEESERAAGLGRAERKPPTVAAVMDDVVLAT